MTWVQALQDLEDSDRAAILRTPPDLSDRGAWLRLAALFDDLHNELTGQGLHFEDAGKACPAPGDTPRWTSLARAQQLFLNRLEETGFADVNDSALQSLNGRPTRSAATVVLAAVSELPALVARALRTLPQQVTALIVAPADRDKWFDDLGCVLPQQWGSAKLPIAPDQVRIVDGPDQQADAAIEALAALEDRAATDQVVIGVPDDDVVPYLQARASRKGGVPMRSARGTPLTQSGPFKLLHAVKTFATSGTFRDWATLLRHPALETYLTRVRRTGLPAESWLSILDDYAAKHIPRRVGSWRTQRNTDRDILESLDNATRGLLGPLWPADHGPERRPAASWADPILSVLRAVYGGSPLNTGDPLHRATLEACESLRESAEEMSAVVGGNDDLPAHAALGMLLQLAGDSSIVTEPDPGAVELLGWLELPFDDAPEVILTGFNEGRVPRSRPPHPLLPDNLCAPLALPDTRSRSARDLYLLSVILASRKHVNLIAGRRTRRDEPLMPSRLLFACAPEELVNRVRLCVPAGPVARPSRLASTPPGPRSLFPIAPRAPFETVKEMRVTSFRSYLRSPYGFFLEHVRRLEESSDLVDSLDPGTFGTMVHETLRDFGIGPAASSSKADQIRESLRSALDAYIARMFGPRPPVAVQLQRAQAAERLDEFAAAQADHRLKGWQILHTEWSPAGGAPFDVDGVPMLLRGTIDRIDRHDQTGHYLILDYKTSDKGGGPDERHRTKAGQWIDLQLPLYRHLAATIVGPYPVALGYVVIPGQPQQVKIDAATWTVPDLEAADNAARAVIRQIRAGEFFDLGDQPPENGILGAICGLNLVSTDPEPEEES